MFPRCSILFLTALSTVSSLPPHPFEPRQDADTGTVVMCTDFNWKGQCIAMTVPLQYNSCTSLKAPWAYNVSSFAPVPGTVCWLHNSNTCSDICMSPQGCNKIVQFPGYGNLSEYGYPGWTDRIGSFTCLADGKTFFE